MSWWLIPAVIGVIVAAIAVGLLVSYIILKIQKRPWPFSRQVKINNIPVSATTVVEAAPAKTQSRALAELEDNLKIAGGSANNGLVKYEIEVWNTRRNEFDVLDSAVLGELTEAYVDMILANNIIWMSTELGQKSQDVTDNYTRLSAKVAERLKRIMPAIRERL